MIPYRGTYRVTQPYKGIFHQGIDLVGVDSKIIYSTISGRVITARMDTYFDGGMGNYIKIQDNQGRFHLFAHLSKFLVYTGQVVKEGDAIGVEGNTGHSFGSHCHYEIRESNSSYSFLNVSEIMHIPNQIGTYESGGVMSNKDKVRIKYGFSEDTMAYLSNYKYAESLFIMMLKPVIEQNYQLNTIDYLLKYEYGVEVFNRLILG